MMIKYNLIRMSTNVYYKHNLRLTTRSAFTTTGN